ncbi:MAG: hypothetical protein WCA35_10660 [Kovacikia sp.]
MNLKIPDCWTNVLGASLVLLASSTFFHGFRPLSSAQESAKESVETAPASIDHSSTAATSFSYVAASAPASTNASVPSAANSALPACPTPNQKGTGVLIEGDRPGETTGRKEKIEEVVRQNRLTGKWCTSAKTRNATWNMDGISVDEALRAFDLFKSAGLISLAHPTNSPVPGKVTWQRTGAEGNGSVSARPQIDPASPLTSPNLQGSGESGINRRMGRAPNFPNAR